MTQVNEKPHTGIGMISHLNPGINAASSFDAGPQLDCDALRSLLHTERNVVLAYVQIANRNTYLRQITLQLVNWNSMNRT
jgi:hypothetical protein